MSRDETDHDDLQVILEPVNPGSIYTHVEIDQSPIRIGGAFGSSLAANLGAVVAGVLPFTRRILPSALLVASLVVGAELVIRTVEPRLVDRTYDAWHTSGHPLLVNEEGYRGPRVAATPSSDGTRRVLALGDSVTFGTGTAFASTWPAQLEAKAKGRLQVLNLGVPATSLEEIEHVFARYVESHAPDAAALVLTGNMVSLGWIKRDEAASDPLTPPPPEPTGPPGLRRRLVAFKDGFALVGTLSLAAEHFRYWTGLSDHLVNPDQPGGALLAHGLRQADLPKERIDQAWSRFERDLTKLASRARSAGVELVVSYAPPRFYVDPDPSWQQNPKRVPLDRFTIDPIARVSTLCARLGLPFVDPRDVLRATRDDDPPHYVVGDYAHFDDAGHARLAQVLSEALER